MNVDIAALEPQTLSGSSQAAPQSQATNLPPLPPNKRPSRKFVWILVALFLSAAFGGTYGWWRFACQWVSTDNAYVSGHIHQISSRIPGTVKEVLAEENVTVAAGAVLARLDRNDLDVKRQQVAAQLRQADADLQRAHSEIARSEAVLAEQQAEQRKADLDLQRAKQLFGHAAGAISRQEFDHAQAAFDARQAALKAAASVLRSARAAAAAAAAQQTSASAALADVELQLGYTDIVAPAPGRIGRKNIEAGNRVQPGQALLGLVGRELWVTANFKETQLDRLRPGQKVRVRLDAFPKRLLAGRLESFSPASGAQFALLPPDNATGNFLKIVQRVPVRIALLRETLRGIEDRVVPGMSAIVEVYIGE